MANIPSNDPFRTPVDDDLRNPARLDSELQADPELTEGPASGSRIVVYALGIAVLLGAVFYGLNNTAMAPDAAKTASAPVTQDSASKAPAPTNNMADSNTKPPVAPGVRDVTPSNTASGVTTGAAPARPVQPPQSGPTGTQIDSSKGGAN